MIGCFTLVSAALVTALAGVLRWVYLRRRPPAVALTYAALLGLGDFVPAYLVLVLFF